MMVSGTLRFQTNSSMVSALVVIYICQVIVLWAACNSLSKSIWALLAVIHMVVWRDVCDTIDCRPTASADQKLLDFQIAGTLAIIWAA